MLKKNMKKLQQLKVSNRVQSKKKFRFKTFVLKQLNTKFLIKVEYLEGFDVGFCCRPLISQEVFNGRIKDSCEFMLLTCGQKIYKNTLSPSRLREHLNWDCLILNKDIGLFFAINNFYKFYQS